MTQIVGVKKLSKRDEAMQIISARLPGQTPVMKERVIEALRYAGRRRKLSASPAELEDAARAKASFRYFVEKVWPIVEPDKTFMGNWHIDELCRQLEAITRGESRRTVINVPPGAMKSLLVSVFWPCWMWANNPSLRILCASYSEPKSLDFNQLARDIISSAWFQRSFGVRLKSDQNAKGRFNTTSGGWRIATSVGGKGMGLHPDFIVIDDPITEQQSRSEQEREGVWLWYRRTISLRGASRGASIVIIMQRLHEDDLSGKVLGANMGAKHICFPMYYDPERPDPLDPRRTARELLWPGLFPLARCQELELALGQYGVAGQFQQRPAPEGGGLFQRTWFKVLEPDAVPAGGVELRAWDTAATQDGGDWTVGTKMRHVAEKFIIMDVRRGQWSPAGVDDNIAQCAAMDGRRCRIAEQQEPGSAGKSVISTRAVRLAGYDYGPAPTTGDKITRARPYRAQCEAGNVYIVRGDWNQQFLDEHAIFPNGRHDDQVDATSTAFNELASTKPAQVREVRWG